MVRHGGLTYNDGWRRFQETAGDYPPEEQLQIGEAAALTSRQPEVLATSATDLAARSYAALAERFLTTVGHVTTKQWQAQLDRVTASVRRVLEALPENSAIRTEVARLQERIQTSQEELMKTRASLGHGQVVLGQRTLGPLSHAIVIPTQATPQERHAAEDLQYHLELITGRVLPLLTDDEVKDEIPLVVGRSQLLKKLGVDIDFDALGLEGIAIETKGPALVLAGNKRGVLYAVYTFLEDTLGCRWFTPPSPPSEGGAKGGCATWPQEGRIKVGPISRRYVPPLEYRATDYPNSRDADWAVRNKVNGTQTALDEERGGKIAYAYFVHTFNALIPPERYFDEHPDWFSEINGVRVRDYTNSASPTRICWRRPSGASASGSRRTPTRPSSRCRRTTGTTTASVRTAPPWRRRRAARAGRCCTSSTPSPSLWRRIIRT
jgi:hypothetical protein